MATRTTYVVATPGFIVDHSSITRNDGRVVDWPTVAAGFVDPNTGKKRIPAGTLMGEVTPGGMVVPNTAAPIGLLASDAVEGDRSAALSGYGIIKGGVIFQNLLPGGVPSGASKTALDAAGTKFAWETYADNTAS
jgi:hypothetical protein